ncbi:class I SAM-dependent methyltransferase [Candidatus Woesearchaeota archaeon]|nr:class I SAM-dependent methyltransferase [Candidatus Woesearchaeota archaeon]
MTNHYYSEKQESALALKQIHAVLRGKRFSFFTGGGVFSKDKVDFGSSVLANFMQVGKKDKVLDLGCGIGVIGCVAATLTEGNILLVDVNARAVQLAKKNTVHVKQAQVVQGNSFEKCIGKAFDVILLNPPQSAGKKLCFQMIEDAKNYLSPKGSLQIVARHNKGGGVLSEHMKEVFGNVETLCKKGGYRVYKSVLKA